MKKQTTILFITICLVTSICFSQSDDSTGNKKQKSCAVRLIRTDGDMVRFILGGFLEDSIWGYAYTEVNNRKLIQQDTLVFESSSHIKRLFIKIDKHVYYPVKSTNSTADLQNFKSVLVGDNTKYALLWYPTDFDIALLALDLLLVPKGKWYYVKGDKKRFNRMIKDFTPKKER